MPDHRNPDLTTIRTAVAMALRAPSAHNAQPWQWRIGYRTLHLFANPEPRLGLASCALTEPLATPEARAVLKDVVTDDGVPQVLLRVGWAPANAAPLPSTPRRSLAYVLEPLQAPPKYHHRKATG